MKWTDAEQVGLALLDEHPGVNPLTVRFTDLRQWVLQLEGFDDDPQLSNESRLEGIQMAWYDEWQDRQEQR